MSASGHSGCRPGDVAFLTVLAGRQVLEFGAMASTGQLRAWLSVATRRSVLLQALATAVVVGTILMAINHGDALLNGRLDAGLVLQIGLTYVVPFLVSAGSSATALRRQEGRADHAD
jgi:hypothetical protein